MARVFNLHLIIVIIRENNFFFFLWCRRLWELVSCHFNSTGCCLSFGSQTIILISKQYIICFIRLPYLMAVSPWSRNGNLLQEECLKLEQIYSNLAIIMVIQDQKSYRLSLEQLGRRVNQLAEQNAVSKLCNLTNPVFYGICTFSLSLCDMGWQEFPFWFRGYRLRLFLYEMSTGFGFLSGLSHVWIVGKGR